MVKINISFYEREKAIITKTWILYKKESSYYGKMLVLNFWKYGLLLIQKADVRW